GRATIPGVCRHVGPGFRVRRTLGLAFSNLGGAAVAIGDNFAVKEAGGTTRSLLRILSWSGVGVPLMGLSRTISALRLTKDAVRRFGDARRAASRGVCR